MTPSQPEFQRPSMRADVVCVGFGPATAGFLMTLTQGLAGADGAPALESRVMPGAPPQVLCYERADDLGYGVSGVVTRGRGLKESFPGLDFGSLPLYSEVAEEQVLYLLDPLGASRRPALVRAADRLLKSLPFLARDHAFRLPYVPSFLHKKGGFTFSLGQFNQWVGGLLMSTGLAQVWPASPVAGALIENGRVEGVRLADQGVDARGNLEPGYLPGMDVRAALTVVGDGPVGQVGRQLDRHFGLPKGAQRHEWAVGMKAVVELSPDCPLKPGTVIHTLGYPEPEIFGFLYVYPNRLASAGIFVPSWFDNPGRTAYRYLQHWMQHPALWRHLRGSEMKSWGAKSLLESGIRGEPFLVGDGWARVGENSGSTNVLTGSGVDEAWTTGVQLGRAVVELWRRGLPFDRENLEKAYVRRRRSSWVEREGRAGRKARDGFQKGFVQGMLGMALTGFSKGLLGWPGRPLQPHQRVPTLEKYAAGRLDAAQAAELRRQSQAGGRGVHDGLMDAAGWPRPTLDGRLLVSHQDALLKGGKVRASGRYADHVVILKPELCADCGEKVCVDMCSGQALTPGADGVPVFDREKCVHCGACLWNCAKVAEPATGQTNLDFRAGAGGLHSAEN